MDLLQQIGALAGLVAFFGLAVLALLYFAQARDVRRLRERAAFLPKGVERDEDGTREPVAARAASAQAAQGQEIESVRRAQLAREAAAERRARFEQRRRGGRSAFGLRGRNLPEPRALVVIGLGVVLLGAGLVFGALNLLGGEDEGGRRAGKGGPAPSTIEVAVLNGTAVPGAAARTGERLNENGFKLGAVTNSETSFEQTTVVHDKGGRAAAAKIAAQLDIKKVEPMDADIRRLVEGAKVAVIVGADRAGGD